MLKHQYSGHWCVEPAHWKRSWCWERLRAWGEEGNRGWDGWMASSPHWAWVWANSCVSHYLGDSEGQGGLACCNSWGCKESDTTERLNWTELNQRINWRDKLKPNRTLCHPFWYKSLSHPYFWCIGGGFVQPIDLPWVPKHRFKSLLIREWKEGRSKGGEVKKQ